MAENTESKAPATPAVETYSVAELVQATDAIFKGENVKPYLVEAALKLNGARRFTVAEARKVVHSFANRKVEK